MVSGAQRTFDDMGAPLFEVPFCVLDLETTGATAADCEITEIGAVRFQGGEPTGTFHTLVNPGVPIPPMITVLTGITHQMVVEAPRIGEALPAFLEFIGDAVIVGHNVRFDISFLNAAAERLGYGRLPNRSADTAALARRLVRTEVRNLKLATLAAHFRSPVTPTHRALDDAKATAHLFFELLARAGSIGVSHLDDLMRLPTARGRPHYGKLELTEGLPRAAGVYLFRDRDDEVIYIGKAKNLRTRVRSYFYGDDRKTVSQMLRDLTTIDHQVCATELEAEITEVRLIHANRPRYNRRSRPPKSSQWVALTAERFPRLSIVRKLRDEDGWLHLGPFRSKRHAQNVVTAIWDAVPIRRCIGKGGSITAACHFAQLGVALCPCDGTVGQAEYDEVVSTVRSGIERQPDLLLDPLADRMREHARQRRFEQAADLRDRYRALATALQRRRRWTALTNAGRMWAEDASGHGALIDGGRLAAAWDNTNALPMLAGDGTEPTEVPPSVAVAEECDLVWKWLARPDVSIVASDRPLTMPVAPVVELTTLAG